MFVITFLVTETMLGRLWDNAIDCTMDQCDDKYEFVYVRRYMGGALRGELCVKWYLTSQGTTQNSVNAWPLS
jgi:hypothetical protein